MDIVWDESFSVNDETIDRQHKRLIDMIHTACMVRQTDPASEGISDLLAELSKYAQKHFEYEEGYMKDIAFPDIEAHRSEHRMFKEKVARLCMDALSGKETVVADITDFLCKWALDHIGMIDQKYRRFADSHSV